VRKETARCANRARGRVRANGTHLEGAAPKATRVANMITRATALSERNCGGHGGTETSLETTSGHSGMQMLNS
jgi:hypothetical protein